MKAIEVISNNIMFTLEESKLLARLLRYLGRSMMVLLAGSIAAYFIFKWPF